MIQYENEECQMRNKNFWVLLLLMLAGIVLGGFIGNLAEGISWLSWLNFGQYI